MASFIAASAVAYSGYGAVDVALPAGLSAGDGLFAFVMVEGSDASVTMPSGWDAITVSGTPVAVTANITLRVYRRTRQAGDADVISISASAISQAVTILAFGALGAATVFAANSTGFANQPPSISVTTTSANQWLLYVAGIGTQGRTMTPPAGMTQPAAVASGGSSGSSFVSMGAAYQGPIAAGTYARQATWDGGSPTGALLLAIAEDAGGGGGGGIAGDLADQTTAAGSAAATSAVAAAAADRSVQAGSAAATSAIASSALAGTDQAGTAAASTAITANLSHGLDAVLGSLYGTAAIAAAATGGVACDGSAAGTVAITADAAQTTTQAGDLSAAAVAIRQADIDGAIAITAASDASSAISAGMAQLLDAVLGSYSGSAAIASALLGDAAASSTADAGNAIAAGTAGSVSTGSELSGAAVAVTQADASQILDPVAGDLAASVAISASFATSVDAILASLSGSAAIASTITSDVPTDTAASASSAVAGAMDAVTAMRTALDGAVAITGNNATPTEVESWASAYQRPAGGPLLPAARTYRATLPDRTYSVASTSRRYRAALPQRQFRRAA